MSPPKEAQLDIHQSIRAFIAENFYVPEATPLADDTSLIESGVVDSTGVLEIVAFLERELGIAVPDGDIVPANLDSIGRIAAYAARTAAARAPATFNVRGGVTGVVTPRT